MNQPELTVIVTAHSEGRLLRPTIRSVTAAMENVITAGDTAEQLLLVLDSADDKTTEEAHRWTGRSDFPVRVLTVSLGESGLARNAGAADARGRFVAFVDGDDLVSDNFLAAALAIARSAPVPSIVHPNAVVNFGATNYYWPIRGSDDPSVSYRDLLRYNLWPSCSLAPRGLYLDHPYPSLHPEDGFGPEDWFWNIRTASAGIPHIAAPETLFFYRVRASGGVNQAHGDSLLPPFDIAKLRAVLPLPTEGGSPGRRRRRGVSLYQAVLPVTRALTAPLSFEVRRKIYNAVRGTYRVVTRSQKPTRRTPTIERILRQATAIDPALSSTAFAFDELPLWDTFSDAYAVILDEVLQGLEGSDAIVAVPWVGIGGADLVSMNYARALAATPRFRGKTTFLATFHAERTLRERLPHDVHFVQMPAAVLHYPEDIQRRLLAQAILWTHPHLIVSVNCFHLTRALQTYGRQLTERTSVYSTLFSFDRIGDDYPVNAVTDDDQRTYLDRLSGIITDNTATAALVGETLAIEPPLLQVHRQAAMDAHPPLDTSTAAYQDDSFTAASPLRLVWPHRLDKEKRPDAVVRIAQELRRRGLPVQIDVWGQRVMTAAGGTLMANLKAAGVEYRGPYAGGLAALPTAEYHGLLLTSENEGLPLVLVQSLLLGLPVIATDVGGVPDLIRDRETGMLAASPHDTEGFVDAIEALMASRELRRAIIENGYTAAVEGHSWEAFSEIVREMAGSAERGAAGSL